MGFFSNLIKNAISEGVSKGISEAVGKATRSVVTPKAESLTNKTAEQIDTLTDSLEKQQANLQDAIDEAEQDCAVEGFNGDFDLFPKWDYTLVEELSKNKGDGFEAIILTASMNDLLVRKYQAKLANKGFTGDWQLMSKVIAGKKFVVDFSFVPDSQIQYVIQK